MPPAHKASEKVLDKRNIAEPDREGSVLGAADVPIGTKLGSVSPRSLNGGALLPPFRHQNGSADVDVMKHLPPLQGMLIMKW